MPDSPVVTPYSALAAGYDVVMAHVDYEAWAEYVHRLLVRHAPDARDVLELGCGTGSLALELQSIGKYRYLATDGSARMLAVARAKAAFEDARIQFAEADFTSFRTSVPVDVVLLLYDGLNYLLDASEVSALLSRAHAALRPGGVFLFDISTPANSENNQAFFEDRGEESEFSYVRTSRYDSEKRLHLTQFVLEIAGERFEEEHVQRAYTLEEIRAMLDAADWSEVHAYDGFTTDPATNRTERAHWVLIKSPSDS